MYIISCTTATKRFEWEIETLLTNLKSFDYKKIIILFCGGSPQIAELIEKKYNISCYFYEDDRPHRKYPTSNRPYVWVQFLKENPSFQNEDFFYIDTDIILRQKINLDGFEINENHWLASDCSSYLQPSYIQNFNGAYLESMIKTIGLSKEKITAFEGNSGGAQWLISKPKIEFWQKVYQDSENLYLLFLKLEFLTSTPDRKFQKWCADMWALLWNTAYFNIDVTCEKKLSFSWSINDKAEWLKHDILHNAGVSASSSELFFKGEWFDKSPIGENIAIDFKKCSFYYVNAINQVANRANQKL